MNIKELLKKNDTNLTQMYDYLCEEFHVPFTYTAFINWLNGKRPMRDEYVWLLQKAIKKKFGIDIPITGLFTKERMANLEAKFLRAA